MKVNKLKLIVFLLVILAIIGVVIYCVYANNQEDKPENIEVKYETTKMITNFRMAVSDFDSINPHITQNKDVLQLDSLIFEPLLEITQDYKITNCLAEEWSKVSDRSYVIKLKENVKWQDGTSFTADDVKYTIEDIQKTKKSVYLENVKNIQNVNVVDSYTIRLDLNKEIPFFEYQLIFPILSKKQFEKQDINKSTSIPLGTGKYKIERMTKDVIELSKNENWHNVENNDANIKTITISIFETMGEVYNSFKLGNIDLINTNNVNYEEYIGSMGYQAKQYKGREYDYLSFNCNNVILKNKEVRQAIQKALDKEKLISSVLENKAYVSNFPLDYGSFAIDNIQTTSNTNLEAASKILKDAGWSFEHNIWSKVINGRTRTLNFNLFVNENNKQRLKVADEIKEQLQNFGIKITIKKLSNNDYQNILKKHQYEIILTGVYNGYSPELNSFFNENNLANYQNEEIISILNEVNRIDSEDLLKEKYRRIVQIYNDEVPFLGLYRNKVTVAYGTNVRADVEPNNYSVLYNFVDWYRE